MTKPTLYLFVGYPGAGKTSVAKIIQRCCGATHLWADKIRRERLGPPNYSHQENAALYDHLNQMTAELLRAGNSVIYDTNFKYHRDREKLRQIAKSHNANIVVIVLTTDLVEARHRATKPHHQHDNRIHGTMSDADFKRLSADIEWPTSDEVAIEIDGTKIDEQTVKTKLGLSA